MSLDQPEPVSTSRGRLDSVDFARGVIMVLMALDHTRDFFGFPGQNPTDLATASAGLFLTRWVTHFCAPGFFLLTGLGAGLALRRKSVGELSRFLLTRGLWLVVLDLVVARSLAYQFNADYHVTLLLVLWALGWAMIVLAALIHLPRVMIAMFGIALVAGHNLLDQVQSQHPLWHILHAPGFVVNAPGHVVFVAYPLIPWIGVTALGFVLAAVYRWDAPRRRQWYWRLGVVLTAGFVALRAVNGYGDPSRWSHHPTTLFTVLSFLNVTKYPPSLLFLLMTIGPLLLLLRLVDGGVPRLLQPVVVFGRVPLFYYLLHFFLIHLLAVLVCLVRYGTAHWMFESPDLGHYPFTAPPGWGSAVPVVLAIWLGVVVLCYPLCRWFAGVKQRRHEPWLSYL